MEPTTSELVRMLMDRMSEAEAAIRRIDKTCTFGDAELQKRCGILETKIEEMAGGVNAAAEEDAADGQWGIGDIILAAERVETRKSSEENGSPSMCAWFDDLDDAKSLARYVRESVRFDPLTSTHTVTFIATKVI